jgi:D-alanine transaminase
VLIDAIQAQGMALEERTFTVAEAYGAREAFITGASQTVMPVVRIDEHKIADGKPGPLAMALRRDFHNFAEST